VRYRVLVPKEPSAAIPRGAALLQASRGKPGHLFNGPGQFGELCAKATRRGRPLAIPEGCVEVAELERWLGRRISRADLEALDNRATRRHRARRLFMQGRYAEPARIDPRMGL
jgi:hypothetical protein